MANKKGRPKSYRTDQIKLIIDQYVRYTEGKTLISASKVARFAVEELKLDNFRYYSIQRNPETKQYMKIINGRIKNCSTTNRGTPVAVFKTLDIESMLNMTPKQLKTGLLNLNTMLEDTSDKHAKVIQENMRLNRLCESLKTEAEGYKKELDEAKTREDKLARVIEKQKAEITELVSIMHIAWDKEAETILKKQNIFENDGTEIDKKKTITDPTTDLTKTINIFKIKKNTSESVVNDMRNDFLQGIEDI